ncbi:GCN5-related N-acetyltransferase [Methylobacterium sp. 4-46]|uniref:GNAT family N-acetyltransferase n=1 Tax=unclassified Methylobacterium TaxID=2615210 RepID=UPI000152DD0B|nr:MULTISPECIES: GNAT family N-acetyltransferase [Methylobacterium]ACA20330.1 GCN5-related N-acetyltransferase [Methylobacterium sp. 4-46]WFT79503.1 GNAT family N-acetyltransferase [Methylobacterium nodulans]
MARADDLIVRPCGPEDIPAVQAIYAHAVRTGRASFELDPPDMPEMLRRHAGLVGAGYPYLVAVAGDALLGYAYAGPYRTRPAYRGTVENSVYVDPARLGQGIGRRLLGDLVEAATARGFRQMVAVIGDSANAASIRLHAALGFAQVGVLRAVGWKHGLWLDTVLMQRALGPGDAAPPDAP